MDNEARKKPSGLSVLIMAGKRRRKDPETMLDTESATPNNQEIEKAPPPKLNGKETPTEQTVDSSFATRMYHAIEELRDLTRGNPKLQAVVTELDQLCDEIGAPDKTYAADSGGVPAKPRGAASDARKDEDDYLDRLNEV